MKLLIKIVNDSDVLVDQKVFTMNESEGVSDTNGVTLSGLILLAIRYLASLGPY